MYNIFLCFHYFRLDLISKTLRSNDLTPVNMAHDPYPHDRWNSIYSYCHTFMIFSEDDRMTAKFFC